MRTAAILKSEESSRRGFGDQFAGDPGSTFRTEAVDCTVRAVMQAMPKQPWAA